MRKLDNRELWSFHSRYTEGTEDQCWPWEGSRNKRGYGRYSPSIGECLYAHRIMASLMGLELIGKEVMHSCDNPSCVNPAHLSVGTHKDNMQDCSKKGRANGFKKGIHPHNKKLTTNDVKCIHMFKSRGVKAYEIAHLYGVSNSLVCGILRGELHQNVKVAA